MLGTLLGFHFVYEKNIFKEGGGGGNDSLSVCVLFPGRRRTHPLSTWWPPVAPLKFHSSIIPHAQPDSL